MPSWPDFRSFRVRTIIAVAVVGIGVSFVARGQIFLMHNASKILQLDEYLLGRLNVVLAEQAARTGMESGQNETHAPLSSVDTELCGDVVVSRFGPDGAFLGSNVLASVGTGNPAPQFSYSTDGGFRNVAYMMPDGSKVVLAASMKGYEANKLLRLITVALVGCLIVTFVLLPILWVLLSRAMKRLELINQTAMLVTANNLTARIDVAAMDTEMQSMAINLNAMLDHVNELHQAQFRFVADASHELRTPLAGIIGNSEAQEGRTAEQMHRALAYCHESAQRLSRLVNGLLELTREETSRDKPRHRVLVETLLNEAVEQVESIAHAREIGLEIDIPDASIIVLGDTDELFQVLVNLLSNAIFHSPPGGSVRVEAQRLAGAGFPMVALRVADNGPGIDPDLGPRVFERFYRGSSRYEGSGLGLAICKAIVERYGGTITHRPNAPCGTIFEVVLEADPGDGSRVSALPGV